MLSFTSYIMPGKFSSESSNEEKQFSVPAKALYKQTSSPQLIAKSLAIYAEPFASFAIAFASPAMKQICLSMEQIYSAIRNNSYATTLMHPAIPLFDFTMRQRTTAMRQINLAISQLNPANMERWVEMINYQIVIKNHIGNKFLFLLG